MIPRGRWVFDLIMYKTCSTLFESFTKGSEFGGFFFLTYIHTNPTLNPPPPPPPPGETFNSLKMLYNADSGHSLLSPNGPRLMLPFSRSSPSVFLRRHCHSTSTGRKVQRSNSGHRHLRKTISVSR